MPLSTTQQTIRDINLNSEYWVITDPATGRCFQAGGFIAAWQTQKAAKAAAIEMGKGYRVLKQIKD